MVSSIFCKQVLHVITALILKKQRLTDPISHLQVTRQIFILGLPNFSLKPIHMWKTQQWYLEKPIMNVTKYWHICAYCIIVRHTKPLCFSLNVTKIIFEHFRGVISTYRFQIWKPDETWFNALLILLCTRCA